MDKKQTVAASEVFKICFLGFSNPKRRVYGIGSQARPTNPALRNPKMEVAVARFHRFNGFARRSHHPCPPDCNSVHARTLSDPSGFHVMTGDLDYNANKQLLVVTSNLTSLIHACLPPPTATPKCTWRASFALDVDFTHGGSCHWSPIRSGFRGFFWNIYGDLDLSLWDSLVPPLVLTLNFILFFMVWRLLGIWYTKLSFVAWCKECYCLFV